MKVFVAGATGVLGSRLVPQLVDRGHTVTGMTRSPDKSGLIEAAGATPAVAEALDPEAVAEAVGEADPDVIVHQLTALSGSLNLRHFDRSFALTNRLRTEGTDILLSAGRAVGVERFVAQSYAGWPLARTGGPVKSEDEPLDPTPPAGIRESHAAIRHLEEAVASAEWTQGIALRYGGFYGAGTSLSVNPEGEHVQMLRKRQFPIVGGGSGVWSFVHIDDAATATTAVIEHGNRGVYNIVDDDPAPVTEWLPAAAAAVGAKPPMRLPRWLGRMIAGEVAAVMMTEIRGASNTKAKRELDWHPRFASWREGFAHGLG